MRPPDPKNEPVLSYAPGTPERAELTRTLDDLSASPIDIALRIGGEDVVAGEPVEIRAPHRRDLVLGRHSVAGESEVTRAVEAAVAAREGWAMTDFTTRASIFLRAADLLAGPWRQRLNASTMLGQSKTVVQAEIDAACELVDFFRFNVHFASKMLEEQPASARGAWNRLDLRPLDGFVYAVTPFNFTSIAGNLPTAPALMGNTVVWKPSPNAVYSGSFVLAILREAGLPDGVVSFVPGDAEEVTRVVLESPDFGGLHFTGSTVVFRSLWRRIAEGLDRFRSYPRIVGETGGKDFVIAHGSADVEALSTAIVRGAFEFQGQKCSAVSRVYVPRSLWPEVERKTAERIDRIRIGDPRDFRNFMGAVIDGRAYEKITRYQQLAKSDPKCRVIRGGTARDDEGWFVNPTFVECADPRHALMSEEIFGPVVAVYVYDDDRWEEALSLCDTTSPYGLTGAVFARDRAAVEIAGAKLRHAAGNFYVNDKPTGAVVGQQPFGGSRASGTNDKAGSAINLWRWVSPRTLKETFVPPTDFAYPSMAEE